MEISEVGRIYKSSGQQQKSRYMKHLLVFISFFFGGLSIAECQGIRVDKGIYVDYRMVIEELKTSIVIKELSDKWDYKSILLLDSSEIKIINKVRPDIVKDFREYFSKPVEEKYRKILATDKKSIKDCVNNFKLYCITENGPGIDSRLYYPFYVKDDKIALYEIYGNSWSECYRITLLNKKLLIELIDEIIE